MTISTNNHSTAPTTLAAPGANPSAAHPALPAPGAGATHGFLTSPPIPRTLDSEIGWWTTSPVADKPLPVAAGATPGGQSASMTTPPTSVATVVAPGATNPPPPVVPDKPLTVAAGATPGGKSASMTTPPTSVATVVAPGATNPPPPGDSAGVKPSSTIPSSPPPAAAGGTIPVLLPPSVVAEATITSPPPSPGAAGGTITTLQPATAVTSIKSASTGRRRRKQDSTAVSATKNNRPVIGKRNKSKVKKASQGAGQAALQALLTTGSPKKKTPRNAGNVPPSDANVAISVLCCDGNESLLALADKESTMDFDRKAATLTANVTGRAEEAAKGVTVAFEKEFNKTIDKTQKALRKVERDVKGLDVRLQKQDKAKVDVGVMESLFLQAETRLTSVGVATHALLSGAVANIHRNWPQADGKVIDDPIEFFVQQTTTNLEDYQAFVAGLMVHFTLDNTGKLVLKTNSAAAASSNPSDDIIEGEHIAQVIGGIATTQAELSDRMDQLEVMLKTKIDKAPQPTGPTGTELEELKKSIKSLEGRLAEKASVTSLEDGLKGKASVTSLEEGLKGKASIDVEKKVDGAVATYQLAETSHNSTVDILSKTNEKETNIEELVKKGKTTLATLSRFDTSVLRNLIDEVKPVLDEAKDENRKRQRDETMLTSMSELITSVKESRTSDSETRNVLTTAISELVGMMKEERACKRARTEDNPSDSNKIGASVQQPLNNPTP